MKKKYIEKMFIFVLSLLLGSLLAFQMKQNIDDYTLVTLNSIHMLQNEVNNNKVEIKNIKELIDKRKQELEKYKNSITETGSIKEVLEKDLEEIKMITGITDVEGPGVYVFMQDNDDEYQIGEDLNYDVIHNVDVLHIINDLRAADAEAISINGVRLLGNSEVVCDGPIITINEEIIAAPFIIKAIGDPKVLYAAINAPNTYGYWLRKTFNIKIETRISDNVKIPKYTGQPVFKYAQIEKEEGE